MFDDSINYYNILNTISYLVETSCAKIVSFFSLIIELAFEEEAYNIQTCNNCRSRKAKYNKQKSSCKNYLFLNQSYIYAMLALQVARIYNNVAQLIRQTQDNLTRKFKDIKLKLQISNFN